MYLRGEYASLLTQIKSQYILDCKKKRKRPLTGLRDKTVNTAGTQTQI